MKTEENGTFTDVKEKISVLQAASQPEGLSFRVINKMFSRKSGSSNEIVTFKHQKILF